MIIAVDFDGTIVEHKFPDIGEERLGAVETLKWMQSESHKVIIWTCRNGARLASMMNWLKEQGFTPDAVNSNIAHCPGFAVPKILADIYIDDRNLGGIPPWNIIRKVLSDGNTL